MKIPGFSFWALLTTAILFVLLVQLNTPMPLAIAMAVTWYLFGLGAAYAVYRYHHPELDLSETLAPFTTGGRVPEGFHAVTFANQGRTVFVPEGGNLREYATTQGAEVYYDVAKAANCFGMGFCGTCRYTPGANSAAALSVPTWQERFTLGGDVGTLSASPARRKSSATARSTIAWRRRSARSIASPSSTARSPRSSASSSSAPSSGWAGI